MGLRMQIQGQRAEVTSLARQLGFRYKPPTKEGEFGAYTVQEEVPYWLLHIVGWAEEAFLSVWRFVGGGGESSDSSPSLREKIAEYQKREAFADKIRKQEDKISGSGSNSKLDLSLLDEQSLLMPKSGLSGLMRYADGAMCTFIGCISVGLLFCSIATFSRDSYLKDKAVLEKHLRETQEGGGTIKGYLREQRARARALKLQQKASRSSKMSVVHPPSATIKREDFDQRPCVKVSKSTMPPSTSSSTPYDDVARRRTVTEEFMN